MSKWTVYLSTVDFSLSEDGPDLKGLLLRAGFAPLSTLTF